MINLTPYALRFDSEYPKYRDDTYLRILAVVAKIPSVATVKRMTADPAFQNFLTLADPVIAIKNYKSQIPFPTQLVTLWTQIAELKDCSITGASLLGEPGEVFRNIISLDGFQLPTVSAIYHFCHPGDFPIVDRNVAAACDYLCRKCDKLGLAPKLPPPKAPAECKMARYTAFIKFIEHLLFLMREGHAHPEELDFRFIDKALMVLGADVIKQRESTRKNRRVAK